MRLWKRSDFAPGDLLRDKSGVVWKVIGIADDPTVEVVTVDEMLSWRENHVIASRNFAERFPEKLEPRSPE
jgi:hypothetical protein